MHKTALICIYALSLTLSTSMASAQWVNLNSSHSMSTSVDTSLIGSMTFTSPIFYRIESSSLTALAGFTVTIDNGSFLEGETGLSIYDTTSGGGADLDRVNIFSLNADKNELKLSTNSALSSGDTVRIVDSDSGNSYLSIDASNGEGKTVSLNIVVNDAFQGIIETKETGTCDIVEFSPLLSENKSSTPATGTIDLTSDTNLLGGSDTTTSATYKIDAPSYLVQYYNKSNDSISQIDAGKILFTISGDMSAISKIEAGSSITGSDSTGNTTGCTAGNFSIDENSGKAYAVNSSSLATNTSSSSITVSDIKVTFNGTNTINGGSWNIFATAIEKTGKYSEYSLDPFVFLTLTNNSLRFVVPCFTNNIKCGPTIILNNQNQTDAPVNIEVLASSDNDILPSGSTGILPALPARSSHLYTVQEVLSALGMDDELGSDPVYLALEFTVNSDKNNITGVMFQSDGGESRRTVPLLVDTGVDSLRLGW